MSEITPGTTLTCANPDCGCEVEVRQPCPHGDDDRCACGHSLRPAATTGDSSLLERVEAAGIVDQQAVLVDDVCPADVRPTGER